MAPTREEISGDCDMCDMEEPPCWSGSCAGSADFRVAVAAPGNVAARSRTRNHLAPFTFRWLPCQFHPLSYTIRHAHGWIKPFAGQREELLMTGRTMRRRDFLTLAGGAIGGALTAWPPAARALEPGHVRRVGIIVEGMRSPAYDGFLQGMDDLGYAAGKDYFIEWRFADGRFLRTLDLVQEFDKLKV